MTGSWWHAAEVSFFFFFQAEDGIRDLTVTGVQTCALPIYGVFRPALLLLPVHARHHRWSYKYHTLDSDISDGQRPSSHFSRSEERRVGKECRSRGSRSQ